MHTSNKYSNLTNKELYREAEVKLDKNILDPLAIELMYRVHQFIGMESLLRLSEEHDESIEDYIVLLEDYIEDYIFEIQELKEKYEIE